MNKIIDVPFYFIFCFRDWPALLRLLYLLHLGHKRRSWERRTTFCGPRSRFLFESYRYLPLDWIVGYSRPLWLIQTSRLTISVLHFRAITVFAIQNFFLQKSVISWGRSPFSVFKNNSFVQKRDNDWFLKIQKWTSSSDFLRKMFWNANSKRAIVIETENPTIGLSDNAI